LIRGTDREVDVDHKSGIPGLPRNPSLARRSSLSPQPFPFSPYFGYPKSVVSADAVVVSEINGGEFNIMSIGRLILICNIGILILFMPITGFSSEKTMSLGLLRSDGVLIPWANYESGSWKKKWPEPVESVTDKIESLKDIPPNWLGENGEIATRWFLVDSEKGRRAIKIVKPFLYDAHCGFNWGLLTDQGGMKSKYAYTRKTGIVTDSKVDLIKSISVYDNKKTKESVLKAISQTFDDLEDARISDQLDSWFIQEKLSKPPYKGKKVLPFTGHPFDADKRRAKSIKITKLYSLTLPGSGEALYYIEAERSYEHADPHNAYPCRGVSFLNAYIKSKEGKLSFLANDLVLTDCEMKSAGRTTPFGMIELGEEYYIITESTGYEGESYEIYKLGENDLTGVLSVSGGGC
jgi:hypothetical protein